jgi:hypothetical protein
VPDHDSKASVGLQNLMQWCVEAKEAMRKLILNMDKQPISKVVKLIEKLKTEPDTGFPHIEEGIWENAVQRANKIIDRHANKQKTHNWRLGDSFQAYKSKFAFSAKIISELAEVFAKRKEQSLNTTQDASTGMHRNIDNYLQEAEKYHTEVRFFRAVEKIYQIMDENYNRGLIKLEQTITDILKQISDSLTAINYPLYAYDTLMGIGIKEHLANIRYAYETQTLVDWVLFKPTAGTLLYHKPRTELVDNALALLREILAIKKQPGEIEDIKNFLQNNLRKAIHGRPNKEVQVQDIVETLLIGLGLQKGKDYEREVGRVKISHKEGVPDFILPKAETALEVKLSKSRSKSKTIVDEINADIRTYSQKYPSLVFIVYDLGTIKNEQEFKQGLESETVSILIVKH